VFSYIFQILNLYCYSYIFWKHRYSVDENIPKALIVRKGTQGSVEEQIFHNRMTIKEVTQIREDNIEDNVMTLCSLILIWYRQIINWYLNHLQDYLFTCKASIDRLQMDNKWWYMSGNVCSKLCSKRDDKYYCENYEDFSKKTTAPR
jgi:hypothetical protein